MSYLTHLECAHCGERHDARVLQNLCRSCASPLLARYDLEGVAGAMTKERLAVVTLLVQGIAHEAPEAHRRWLAGGPVAAAKVIAKLITEGQSRGEFRPDADGQVAARLLVSGLLQQTVWQQYGDDVPDLAIAQERLVDSALELFLSGLRAATPRRALPLKHLKR